MNKIKSFWNNLSGVQQGWAMVVAPSFIVWLMLLVVFPKFTIVLTVVCVVMVFICLVGATVCWLFAEGVEKISRGRRGR